MRRPTQTEGAVRNLLNSKTDATLRVTLSFHSGVLLSWQAKRDKNETGHRFIIKEQNRQLGSSHHFEYEDSRGLIEISPALKAR